MVEFKWRFHVIRWLMHLLLLSANSNAAKLSSQSPLLENNSTREVPLKLSSPSTSAIVSDRAITSKPTPATTTPSLNQILNENIVHIPLPVTPTSQPETGEGAAGVRPVSELINATVLHNTSVANHTDGLATQTSQNTSSSTTSTAKSTTEAVKNTTEATEDVLPEAGAAEEEHHNSMSIFLVLAIIGLCILMIHYMTRSKLRFLPESVAVVFLGALIGLILQILSKSGIANWQREEAFSPTVFFLIILPPIIFESGYNLHKGNFFQNFGTILLFAVIGTSISALVVGGGIYLLGVAEVAYQLSFVESFAFGSLISAVDPVATLAIFNALDVDPVLNMLVFGESILNDAVAIVLTTTALESGSAAMTTTTPSHAVLHAVGRFCGVFGASAALGTVSALLAALLLKHVDLRNNPSLEFAMMLIFIYAPYGLAEGVHLSGSSIIRGWHRELFGYNFTAAD